MNGKKKQTDVWSLFISDLEDFPRFFAYNKQQSGVLFWFFGQTGSQVLTGLIVSG